MTPETTTVLALKLTVLVLVLGVVTYCLGLGLEGYCLGQFIQDHVTLILSHFISRPHSCILARDYNNNNNNNNNNVVYGHIDYTAITLDVLSY